MPIARRRREQLDAGVARPRDERARLGDPVRLGEQVAARLRALVDESDALASSGGVDRRLEPARPPPITSVSTWRCSTSKRSRSTVRVERAEAGGVPQELLVERPEALRAG